MPIASRGASHYINLEQQAFTFSETTIPCLAGRIVSASKVLAEVQRTRVENGKETLWNFTAHAARMHAQKQFRQVGKLRQLKKSWPSPLSYTVLTRLNAAVFITL